ncbi:MAG: hypothetical protein C0410_14655 [Anaerolinea sp.]|nr:hypothetical protein [Anaerolinea sp.]
MFKKLKKYLPWITLISLLVAAVLILVYSTNRQNNLVESPETLTAANQTIEAITSLQPDKITDVAFIEAVDQKRSEKYISQIWLFDQDGILVYPTDMPYSGESAEETAVRQVKQMLSTLPERTLTSEQRMLMLVGSAIQAEGEHSDVYRYRVASLKSESGSIIGYLGLAYDISSFLSSPPQAGYIMTLFGLLISLGVYWLSLAVWTYLDARDHGERAIVWLIYVLIGNVVALIAYLLARNPKTE